MVISIEKRSRIITLYEENKLNFCKGRFSKLKTLASAENIFMSESGLRRLIKKWQNFGNSII
jgi:hypothetical protein